MTAHQFGVALAKRCEKIKTLLLAVALGALLVVFAPADTAPGPVKMPPPKLIPSTIPMGAFYNGARLRIEGVAPAGSGVVIVIEGSERDEFFNRKGRVGPIWLTVDRIHVKHAPSVYLRFSSAAVTTLLGGSEVEEHQLDEAAIMSRIRMLCRCKCSLTDRSQQMGTHDIVPDPAYSRLLYADFLRLKHQEGTYRAQAGAVALTQAASATRYAVDFEWPRKIPPGRYRVSVCACREHKVIAQSTATLQLTEVGFPAYVAQLAFARPWIYGIGAVLVAVLAGFLTDLLTNGLRRKRKARIQPGSPQPEAAPAAQQEPVEETHESEPAHRG